MISEFQDLSDKIDRLAQLVQSLRSEKRSRPRKMARGALSSGMFSFARRDPWRRNVSCRKNAGVRVTRS